MPRQARPLKERFEAKFVRGAADQCWEWLASKNQGYGQIGAGGKFGPPLFAHRVSYELYRGPIPQDLVVDHLCRNRACVNPYHMELVTRAVNVMRGEGISAQKALQESCSNGHEYTASNVYWYNGHRLCRTCRRAADARRR